MDIIGTIIAFTLGIIGWVILVWMVFTMPGVLLIIGGVLLAAFIIMDTIFHIR